MPSVTISANQVSQPQFIATGSLVTITPSTGATATVEYTLDSGAAVANGVATWQAWPNGRVSTATSDVMNDPSYVRVTATGGSVSIDVDPTPSASTLNAFRTDWGSPNNPVQVTNPTNTATSGTTNVNVYRVTVSPSGASTQQYFYYQYNVTYNSAQNMTTGGYLNPLQSVLNTAGAGTHDKLVGVISQLNATGGNITSALGYEASIPTLSASTLIGSYAAYYCPNLSGVANIGNVQQGYAFGNDMVTWHIKNAGKYLNADLRELTPPFNPDLVANRFYSCAQASGSAAANANVAYMIPVFVPSRRTIAKIGINVVTGAAGNCRLGLYKSASGAPTTLIGQSGDISTSTTGDKEYSINTQVDAGMYFVCALFSGTPTIATHTIPAERAVQFGSSTSTAAAEAGYIAYAYGALPSTASGLTYAVQPSEPHAWFRV